MPNNATKTSLTEPEVYAVELAALAREIAMDIFPLETIIELHRLTDDEWATIQRNPKFISMLADMTAEWQSAMNTRERVKIKAATGLESILETYIRDIGDPSIPLAQRVEAGKFLARVGELDGNQQIVGGGAPGSSFHIRIDLGQAKQFKTIEHGEDR
jgi:hypothetical protein